MQILRYFLIRCCKTEASDRIIPAATWVEKKSHKQPASGNHWSRASIKPCKGFCILSYYFEIFIKLLLGTKNKIKLGYFTIYFKEWRVTIWRGGLQIQNYKYAQNNDLQQVWRLERVWELGRFEHLTQGNLFEMSIFPRPPIWPGVAKEWRLKGKSLTRIV